MTPYLLAGAFAGWADVALVTIAALAGTVLRRLRGVPFLRRMRPHFALGYAALAIVFVHGVLAMGEMRGANTNGIWAATFAFVLLAAQTFVGTNLRDPRGFRRSLRAWHIGIFATLAVLIAIHVTANGDLLR